MKTRTSGRSRLVEADRASPFYEDIHGLLSKALGVEILLRDALTGIAGIEQAFIYGSWADPAELAPRDVDVMVIGEPNVAEVYDAAAAVESTVGRPVNVGIRSH